MARPRRPGRGRPEARLDPIRWRRPGRGAVIRLAAIAALLVTAAVISWSGPETCASPAGQAPQAQQGHARQDSHQRFAAEIINVALQCERLHLAVEP